MRNEDRPVMRKPVIPSAHRDAESLPLDPNSRKGKRKSKREAAIARALERKSTKGGKK